MCVCQVYLMSLTLVKARLFEAAETGFDVFDCQCRQTSVSLKQLWMRTSAQGEVYIYQMACQKRCLVEVQHELHSFRFFSQANVCGM